MTINERISQIRKDQGLTKGKFGEKIGLRQTQAGFIEKEGAVITERNIQQICTTFNVSVEWLRYGTGEKYIENTESILQQLSREYSLDPDTVTLVRSIVEATPEQRQAIVNFVETTAAKLREMRAKEAELKKQAEVLNHDRPAGLSDDEWELIKQARLEKTMTMSSVSCSGEKERA
jgi:transcriptional regulator with XRE-family HTH domain